MTDSTDRAEARARAQPRAQARAYEADPYDYADARLLMERLELAEPVAITLVRRGHRTEEQARAFIEAEIRHDASELDGIDDAVGLIAAAIEAGERITIHGDYDVDGMAATAILVTALRRAGADCDWLIPDRSADGYGLSAVDAAGGCGSGAPASDHRRLRDRERRGGRGDPPAPGSR